MVIGARATLTFPIVNCGAAVWTSHRQRAGSAPAGRAGQSLKSVADGVVVELGSAYAKLGV
jgi:hypothetical protein